MTPRIVRTHELTQEHLNPIYIGSQMNLGLSGPTPVIGAEPLPAVPEPAAATPPAPRRRACCRGAARRRRAPSRRRRAWRPHVTRPPPTAAAEPPASRSRRRRHVADAAAPPDAAASGAGRRADAARDRRRGAEPPRRRRRPRSASPRRGPEFRVGGGPYTVPIAISNASRLSLMSVSLTYNPALVRVRSVQEGPFFRQGGVTPSFNQQVDPAPAASTSR